mmetsp:Transcript_26097/g.67674  ORF Transcript_26097/g.67674 Transcript_26097/m.67674 type:complete len:567 (-) Transcript_26097:30-1730(-)
MPSAAKRSREAQDDKPAPKRQRGAATSKASTRRALRAALSRYARVGQTALAAVQRAEVLSRRIEAQTREVEVALAGMMPMGAGGPTASALGPDVTAALTKAKRRLASSQRPAPADLALRLDEKGQHVDASGRVVDDERRVASLLVHERQEDQNKPKKVNPYTKYVPDHDGCDVNDDRVVTKKRASKKDRAFAFVQEGHYVKLGEATRAREQQKHLMNVQKPEELDEQPEDISDLDDEEEDRLPPRSEHYASVPGTEWWDEAFLSPERQAKRNTSVAERMKDDYSKCRLDHNRFHGLIHHPSQVRALGGEKKQPANMPFYLTARDRKRVRRQQRAERERERQDKIQLGLIPPPEPKFKLSNFMKVLGEQAVADPSKLERRVMEQVRGRLTKHEMRNQARKLTPQEKKEKMRRKMAEDTSSGVVVAVFYVASLQSSQHRFKIDVNAQQLGLTGGVLICSAPDLPCALVVVEGGPRAVKRFSALMNRRIDWADTSELQGENYARNWAKEVWKGTTVRRNFAAFKFQECKSSLTARRVLDAKGVAHYWDMVASAHKQGPPPVEEDESDED